VVVEKALPILVKEQQELITLVVAEVEVCYFQDLYQE
jgi:hypothetical protein